MTHLILTRDGNSVLLDLFENDPISLNKRYSNIETFEIEGSFSQTFRAPLSPNNQAFFGAVADPNYTSFDFTEKIDAELSEDTIPVSRGYCQIKRMITKGDNSVELELVFFATTPNLRAAIGDKKISELSNLSDLNHAMIFENASTPPANTLWAITEKGQKLSEAGEAGTRRIFNPLSPLYMGDLTPCANGLWLFNEIFKDAGFVYESDFISDRLVQYWMPFISRQAVAVEENENIGFGIYRATNGAVTPFPDFAPLTTGNGFNETFDNGGNVAGGVFTAPFFGYFTFKFTLIHSKDLVPAGTTAISRFQLKNPTNGDLYSDTNGQADMLVSATESGEFTTFQYTRTYLLQENDEAALFFGPVSAPGGPNYILGGGTGWELVSTSDAIQGGTVDFPRNAPDYKQIDFVRDILKMHNLVFIPDPNVPNKVKIEPFTDYIGSGATKDWTGKLDVGDKDVEIYSTADIQNRNLTLTYKAGGEYLSDLFVKQGQRVYGEKEIDNTGNAFATSDRKVELELRSTPCNEINGTAIPVPKFVNETGVFVAPGARILFNAGTAEIALYNEVAEAGELTNVAVLSHYSQTNATLTDTDLNFAAETPLQVITANPFNNLYNEFWADYYNELYSNEARIMEAHFNLSLLDFITVQFNDRIFIRNAYWRVLEISEFFIAPQSTVKVKLAKIVNSSRDCKYIPTAITTAGQVLFFDGTSSDSDGDAACCERYGYQWDSGKEECFALGNGTNRRFNLPTSAEIQKQLLGVSAVSNVRGDEAVINGNNNTTGLRTRVSMINGDSNVVEDDAGGVLIQGDYVKAALAGIHLGIGEKISKHQGGEILYRGDGDYTTSGDEITMESASGKELEMEEQTVWMAEVRASLVDNAENIYSAFYLVRLSKGASLAEAGTVTTVFGEGDLHEIRLIVDTTTNTAQHRFKLESHGGSGYPFTGVRATMKINYTQVRAV
jgi:hypothetical protein